MKKRIITALLIGMTLTVSACGNVAANNAASNEFSIENSNEEEPQNVGTNTQISQEKSDEEKAENANDAHIEKLVESSDENSNDNSSIDERENAGKENNISFENSEDDQQKKMGPPPEEMKGVPDGQAPPEKPDGEGFGGGEAPPEKPDGEMGPGGGPGGPGGADSSKEVTHGDAATNITEDSSIKNEKYTSENDDENALRITGAKVELEEVAVEKSGGASSNPGDGDFYGINAGLLAVDGADVTITGATVNTSAQNGNGVFSYGEGTTVTVSDTTITTTADNSGGIQTTGGGTMNARKLTVNTSGNSSAAIRSDRGGGIVNVDGGTYTSNGYNSPAVYSTADITVNDAKLAAKNSEALVIEGKNSITLNNTDVTGNMSDDKGSSSAINVHNVMIYQSMSGDAEEGTSSLKMKGGKLTSENGDQIYVTNTACTIELSGVDIKNEDTNANFMRIVGNDASHGWGKAGANGGNVTFTADGQVIEGDVVVDTISTLNMTLKRNSTFTGTVNVVENAEGGEAVSDNAVITVEKGSTWNLTGDCKVTSVTCAGTINYNGHTITLADGTILK